MKPKRGDIREDGKIFWKRCKTCQNGEYWITKEKFDIYLEKKREQRRKEYRNNPEKTRIQLNKWREKNREKARNQVRSRRSQMKVDLNENQKKIIFHIYNQAARLQMCLGVTFNVDHIIPISKGGTHIPNNIQAIPARINKIKDNKIIFRWQDYQSPLSSLS